MHAHLNCYNVHHTGSWDGVIRLWKLDASLKSRQPGRYPPLRDFTPFGAIHTMASLDQAQAEALGPAIEAKMTEAGLAQTADAGALSEYILLMLSSGKNQEEVAQELCTEFLYLPVGDPTVAQFVAWIFEQANTLVHGQGAAQQQQSWFQRMWASPVGLKTVHFWYAPPIHPLRKRANSQAVP